MRLEVLDFAGPLRWRWRLTDDAGRFLADHQVSLDEARVSWPFAAFRDLYRWLTHNAAPEPDRRAGRAGGRDQLIPQARAEEALELVARWGPVIAALRAERSGDDVIASTAGASAERFLAANEDIDDGRVLVAVLRRVQAGERGPALLETEGLDDIDRAIVERAVAVLDGAAAVDPDAWHTLAEPDDTLAP